MLELSNKLQKVKHSFMNKFLCVTADNYVTPSAYSTKYKNTKEVKSNFRICSPAHSNLKLTRKHHYYLF